MISFNCSSCESKLKVHDRFGGKKGKCPKCGAVNLIPSPGATEQMPGPDVFNGDPLTSGEPDFTPADTPHSEPSSTTTPPIQQAPPVAALVEPPPEPSDWPSSAARCKAKVG